MEDTVRRVLQTEYGLRVLQRLGHGGFGEVYAAETVAEQVPCAIKVSLDRLDEGNPAVQKELQILRQLRCLAGHPHLVTLMDMWQIAGFLVTRWELATDGSLLDLEENYRRQGQAGIPPQELRRYMWEAAKAIDFLHEHGIDHRDVKPANLLLLHGHVKLADLGLAKVAGASIVSHTGTGTL